jgi:uncharacterized protein DUF1501
MRQDRCCAKIGRRSFLADLGMGFTGLALGSLLSAQEQEHAPWQPPDGRPHFPPRAKSVIWFFMKGGVSHVESFDPKPELNRHGGKSISDTPYKELLESRRIKDKLRPIKEGGDNNRHLRTTLLPMQVGYSRYGEAGIEIADWWPEIGSCADDIAFIRSMWTSDNDHGAILQYHTGRHTNEGAHPTIGSWIHYGLGSLNENLPQFVVLGPQVGECCGGIKVHGADYLGPVHAGVRLNIDPDRPLPFALPGSAKFREEQEAEFDLLGKLNRLAGVEYPDDPVLRARIKSYELAFRMQESIPEAIRMDDEDRETRALYGLDGPKTKDFGQLCLAARRLVERGVRFIQVYHGGSGDGAGRWDAHDSVIRSHSRNSAEADRPIAGLLKDLKRRGLLDETLVVFATEFGRTPGGQGSEGRDHNPMGFSAWLAGGGVRGGVVHGSTDELGICAVEQPHYVTDLHATVMRQMGLDARKLEVPGRKRLEIDYGTPIREILA